MITKGILAEQILNQITGASLVNRDNKIDVREIYYLIDQSVNELARQSYLSNWQLGVGQMDEMYITRFDKINIVDPSKYVNSYLTLPTSGWVSLPRNQGIQEVYFTNDPTKTNNKKYFDTVHIISQRDSIMYRKSPAFALEGRLSVFPKGNTLVFNKSNVGSLYGTVSVALVVKDSSSLSDTDPYPINAAEQQMVIDRCVKYFLARRMTPVDGIRDFKDKPEN